MEVIQVNSMGLNTEFHGKLTKKLRRSGERSSCYQSVASTDQCRETVPHRKTVCQANVLVKLSIQARDHHVVVVDVCYPVTEDTLHVGLARYQNIQELVFSKSVRGPVSKTFLIL